MMKFDDAMARHFGGKTIVLTGAASGIGRAMTRSLSRSGATVFALDANEAGLEALAREASGSGEIHPVTLDVRCAERYSEVIRDIRECSGSIDFLFNNAGVTHLGEAQRIPFDRWKRLLDINLMGVVNGCHLLYPVMIGQGSGHIINTASLAGATGYATAAGYAASKAAILELSRSLRMEAEAYGVRVSVACPGYVNSGIFAQDHILGVDREAVIKDLPVRMMTPEKAARDLLTGVIRGKEMIVFPLSARILWGLANWIPSAISPFQRKLIKVFRQ